MTEGIVDSAQLHTGIEVHTSESPAPPGEYGCRWSTAPKCGSLLTEVAETLAEEVATAPNPTASPFVFSETGGAAFSAQLTVTSEKYVIDDLTWTLETPSTLPPGVELTSEGAVKGNGTTPTGKYTFNARVSVDVSGSREVTRSATVELTIG